jgi:hypothetical protein
MKKLHADARAELTQLTLPADGKVGGSGSVKESRRKLDEAAKQIPVPE